MKLDFHYSDNGKSIAPIFENEQFELYAYVFTDDFARPQFKFRPGIAVSFKLPFSEAMSGSSFEYAASKTRVLLKQFLKDISSLKQDNPENQLELGIKL